MITVTLTPQTGAHVDIVAQAMKALLDSLSPPAVAPTQQAVAAAVEHAAQEVAKPPKPRKANAAATPAAPSVSPEDSGPVATTAETPAASPSEPAPAITLEQVRAKLAALSQGGKQKEVLAIIQAAGATRLTEIPADKYADVMAKAEELAA